MTNLKDKTAIVVDNGMFIELAIRLSRDFGTVYYFSPWISEYPLSKDNRVGYGVSEIERIQTFWDYIDEADIFIFPSIYFPDWQECLKNMGKRVVGSGWADQLERDRYKAYKKYVSLGLPQPGTIKIKGIDNLREHLNGVENKWIKVSEYRGGGNETWHHVKPELSQRKLNKIQDNLGGEGSIAEWLVVDAIDGDDVVECGVDIPMSVDGQFPKKVPFGYEKKDCCYLGRVKPYADISPLITDFNVKIAPILKREQYRNCLSTEIRVGKDKVPYMVDFTARFPSPPGEIYLELIENLGEVYWGASEGRMVEPVYKAKYAMQISIDSCAAENCWLTVCFPEKIRKWVKLRNFAIIDGKYCIIPRYPDFNNVGSIVAIGDSIKEVEKLARSYCEQVEGEDIQCKVGDIQKVMDIIEKGKSLGISF